MDDFIMHVRTTAVISDAHWLWGMFCDVLLCGQLTHLLTNRLWLSTDGNLAGEACYSAG